MSAWYDYAGGYYRRECNRKRDSLSHASISNSWCSTIAAQAVVLMAMAWIVLKNAERLTQLFQTSFPTAEHSH